MKIYATMLMLIVATNAKASFEEPSCLQRNIDFWEAIYTKYDADTALVFEPDSMNIIEIVRGLPEDPAKRRTAIKRIKKNHDSEDARIQTGISSKFLEGLDGYVRYRKIVLKELKKRHLPLEIVALPHVESSYNPLAKSKVGAMGMWQVMPATAKLMGFNAKRLNEPVYNTMVGLSILENNFNTLHSWPLAITAYNHGLYGIERAVKMTGSTDICQIISKYDGPRFGVSSKNFYASFLAVLRILRTKGLLQ
jgi:membrane-bound lytic murein transglycosylase D